MVSNWSSNPRRTNGGQVQEALERYTVARHELDVATYHLHHAEQRGESSDLVAAAAREVQAATATERLAYARVIELLDTSRTPGPDPVTRQPPTT